MLTLAIDTSTEWGTIALGSAESILLQREFRGPMRHSSTLFPALAEFQINQRKIDRIIVGLGPGSFSGIRVSLAAAQGIATATGAEVVGLCSAWSVAQQLSAISSLGIFADARRGEFYCTAFSGGTLTRPTYLLPRERGPEEAQGYTLAVSAESLPGITERAFPRAADFLTLADDSQTFVRDQFLEPIYLREPLSRPAGK